MVSKRTRRKIKADNKQKTLSFGKPEKAKEKDAGVKVDITMSDERYHCPFCLWNAKIHEFKVLLKSGKPSKMYRCPDCQNQMRQNTLTENRSVEEYAQWCFDYSSSGFWDKVPFEKFNKRLRNFGMSRRFWKHYKMLKGEGDVPDRPAEPIFPNISEEDRAKIDALFPKRRRAIPKKAITHDT